MKNLSILFELLAYDGAPTNNPTDCEKVKNAIEDTSITVLSRQQLVLADGGVDIPVALPDTTCEYIVILTDREVSIKLNAWTSGLSIKPKVSSKKSLAFYAKSPVTALKISNASGSNASVDVILIK